MVKMSNTYIKDSSKVIITNVSLVEDQPCEPIESSKSAEEVSSAENWRVPSPRSDDDDIQAIDWIPVNWIPEEDDAEIDQLETEENDKKTSDKHLSKDKEVEPSFKISFCPPVYLQRYTYVGGMLKAELLKAEDKSPKAILEVGCAEFKMFEYIKKLPSIEKIIMMDIDKAVMENNKRILLPSSYEVVYPRETPLVVEAYAGCITKVDSRILNSDPKIFAIIAIEVIEHLNPDIGIGFEKSLFSTIQPPLIILTTPNSEYNVVFGLEKGKFRHWDHRFEWSRQEFMDWCERMCAKYPYSYIIEGIGRGPEEFNHLGSVSQVAVFRKNDDKVPSCLEPEVTVVPDSSEQEVSTLDNCYNLITREVYPFGKDDPATDEERIVREFKRKANGLLSSYTRTEIEENELTEITYPLSLVRYIPKMPKLEDKSIIRKVLQEAGYEMRKGKYGDVVIVIPVPEYKEPPKEHQDSDYDDKLLGLVRINETKVDT